MYLQESLIVEKDEEWLHELALRNTAMESSNFYMIDSVKFNFKDLELIAKNCSESLVSVKISECDLTDLSDFFNYAVKLQEFGGGAFSDQPKIYAELKFPAVFNFHGIELNEPTRNPCNHPFHFPLNKTRSSLC
ncbi:unnamed protein product [Lactuca virosa]|uniref:DUF38 domain-containing protein n=1 Tax=Lactuca virosa TaxID=75947 RepID=A0AAU9NQ94_9ASTR|nr:unnamed protein product [Lactuca virosa]